MQEDPDSSYDSGARAFAGGWEAAAFARIHAAALPHIPSQPGLVLDVGAGSGRDAAWFACRGWRVVAVEPAGALREVAGQLHRMPGIAWENDRLPGLERTLRLGLSFDLVWLSAVWMHVAPADRARAFRKLVTLLKPGGRMMLSLRRGPDTSGRPMHPVDPAEVERLAGEHGLTVRAAAESEDAMGRAEVRWTVMVLPLPDDGTGALPLIRGIVLQDRKAATYKLALVRVLARIADQSAAMARHHDDHVEVPLGLVALYWLRMFKALTAEDILRAPSHRGCSGLGFMKAAHAAIAEVPALGLRPGASFDPLRGRWVARAIGDAAATITRMPAHYLPSADGRPIFPTDYRTLPTVSGQERLVIDPPFLWAFGSTRIPLHVWAALRRLAAWIEPMLLAEWSRLSVGYATRQGRAVSLDTVLRALRWISPERDTLRVRRIAAGLIAAGRPVHCVWTGARPADADRIEIDHCFPFAAWPCDDLWNLMPASRRANQHKSDRLVSAAMLVSAEDRIRSWWDTAYRRTADPLRYRQFEEEARATLPVEGSSIEPRIHGSGLADVAGVDDWQVAGLGGSGDGAIFAALLYQRLRLRQDQNLPEWHGIAG
jgi:SAM-dependent methyltransferase